MKLSRPAAVIAAVVVLAGGAAVAETATSATAPVTLCSSAKNGAVTVPTSSGACAKGTTAFAVASDAAIQALGTRLLAQETENARQATSIAALAERVAAVEPGVLTLSAKAILNSWEYEFTLVGTKLKPGAPVRIHFIDIDVPVEDQWQTWNPDGTLKPVYVSPDGTVNESSLAHCGVTQLYLTTVRADGEPVSSNVIEAGPGC